MDFFEHQERARRKTSRLVFFYFLAVALIIVTIYFTVAILVHYGIQQDKTGNDFNPWNPVLFMWVALAIGGLMLLGTVYKIFMLAGGGKCVAEMFGGRLVDPATTNAGDRRVLNVVEEMAVASGTAVPPVYILDDEDGINAFAAGYTPQDAVVAVTRGCVERLSRDELQGVIAHEFSHVFNGDMRLNIRLMGVLHGILIIALVGYYIFRAVSWGNRGRRSEKKGGGVAAIALFGLALMVIGYIGVFFGKLIKSAISRQREFLADASAVQFTRNPAGIGGALRKIMRYAAGSRVAHPDAESASHFFFANGVSRTWFSMMATHPPLEERIRTIDPALLAEADSPAPADTEPHPEGAVGLAEAAGIAGLAGGKIAYPRRSKAEEPLHDAAAHDVLQRVGSVSQEHIAYASEMLAAVPEQIRHMIRDGIGAQAVVYAMILDKRTEIQRKQVGWLANNADGRVHAEVLSIHPLTRELPVETLIPIADLAIPALRRIDARKYEEFRANIMYLVSADMEIGIFEYALMRLILRNLDPHFRGKKASGVLYLGISQVRQEFLIALSTLARFGAADETDAAAALQNAVRGVPELTGSKLLPTEQCSLEVLDNALDKLAASIPAVKRRIVAACAACVASDNKVTTEEGELLRAVADALDCPMPPFIPKSAAA